MPTKITTKRCNSILCQRFRPNGRKNFSLGESPAVPRPDWFQEGDFHVPLFYSLHNSASAECALESYTLVGTKSSYEDAKNKVILVFARCGLSTMQPVKTQRPQALQMNFTIESIEVPTADLATWMFEQNLASVPTSAYKTANAWIHEKKARVADIRTIQGQSGQRCRSGSISEIQYATELTETPEGEPRPSRWATPQRGRYGRAGIRLESR
jgi:hypothetical protein